MSFTQIVIIGLLRLEQKIIVESVKIGDFKLRNCFTKNVKSDIVETIVKTDQRSSLNTEAKGFIKNSCTGSVVASVFFGEAGVGKSTILSLGKGF